MNFDDLADSLVEENMDSIFGVGARLLKGASEEIKLRLRTTYTNYLKKSFGLYGKSRSFLIRNAPEPIYNFYVPLGVSIGKEKISNASISDLTAFGSRCVIQGLAGSGKSVFMRHLLLTALILDRKIPVFVELRRLNNSTLTLKSLVRQCLQEGGFDLGASYINKAMKLGHFALLFDGYDEIDYARRGKITEEILSVSDEMSDCTIIVSSRPDESLSGWERFSVFSITPLTLSEAVEVIRKIPYDEDIKERFIGDLERTLYNTHNTFLSNPLLLSIMFLTYEQNSEIPHKISLFYNYAYEALFQKHDAAKASFRRDRRTKMDIQDFARIFSLFSFLTYDKKKFSFSVTEAVQFIKRSGSVSRLKFDATDYLLDAKQAVCLLIDDGLNVAFSHRSFQEYFVARLAFESVPEIQERVIDLIIDNAAFDNVINILYELSPDLVEREVILRLVGNLFSEIGLRAPLSKAGYIRYLKSVFSELGFYEGNLGRMSWGIKSPSHLMILLSRIPEYMSILLAEVKRPSTKSVKENKIADGDYVVSALSDRSPIFSHLYSGNESHFHSPAAVRATIKYLDILRDRHKNPVQAIDDLLLP